MDKWPHEVKALTRAEINQAIASRDWQACRLHLKNMETGRKLDVLERWYEARKGPRWVRVCVDNYINALKRGGQLNMNLEVVK